VTLVNSAIETLSLPRLGVLSLLLLSVLSSCHLFYGVVSFQSYAVSSSFQIYCWCRHPSVVVVSFNLAVDVVVIFPFSSAFPVPSWHLTLTPPLLWLVFPATVRAEYVSQFGSFLEPTSGGVFLIRYHVGI
jgi:hypothetical protein